MARPPELIKTRWRSFLEVIKYYVNHFKHIEMVFLVNEENLTGCQRNKNIIDFLSSKINFYDQLVEIDKYYGFEVNVINPLKPLDFLKNFKKLRKQGFFLYLITKFERTDF